MVLGEGKRAICPVCGRSGSESEDEVSRHLGESGCGGLLPGYRARIPGGRRASIPYTTIRHVTYADAGRLTKPEGELGIAGPTRPINPNPRSVQATPGELLTMYIRAGRAVSDELSNVTAEPWPFVKVKCGGSASAAIADGAPAHVLTHQRVTPTLRIPTPPPPAQTTPTVPHPQIPISQNVAPQITASQNTVPQNNVLQNSGLQPQNTVSPNQVLQPQNLVSQDPFAQQLFLHNLVQYNPSDQNAQPHNSHHQNIAVQNRRTEDAQQQRSVSPTSAQPPFNDVQSRNYPQDETHDQYGNPLHTSRNSTSLGGYDFAQPYAPPGWASRHPGYGGVSNTNSSLPTEHDSSRTLFEQPLVREAPDLDLTSNTLDSAQYGGRASFIDENLVHTINPAVLRQPPHLPTFGPRQPTDQITWRSGFIISPEVEIPSHGAQDTERSGHDHINPGRTIDPVVPRRPSSHQLHQPTQRMLPPSRRAGSITSLGSTQSHSA